MGSKYRSLRWMVPCALAGLLLAGTAAAVPISMDPGQVAISTVLGLGNDFTLEFDGGDTSDNRLDFSIAGDGGWGTFGAAPSIGLAALVFDDVSVLSAGEIGDTANLINGISIPDLGAVAALLIDVLSPSSASFFVETSATPTTATIYSLSLADIAEITNLGDIFDNIVDFQPVSFSSPGPHAPEPTAALVFGLGFLFVRASCRR